MISLDQVLLLEQKVESAVAKIQQLEAENDALRNKCSELTNALSAKSEQLTAFESDQKKIETGIIKAIDRLNSIENSVLKAAGQSAPKEAPVQQEEIIEEEPLPETIETAVPEEEVEDKKLNSQALNFDTMEPVESAPDFEEEIPEDSGAEPESTDELGFDIF